LRIVLSGLAEEASSHASNGPKFNQQVNGRRHERCGCGGVALGAVVVIGLPRGLSVYACSDPVDMRKSFDTLAAVVATTMKREVLTGDLFLSVSKDRKRAKVLYFDGTGMCLLAKRLDKGRFSAPWKMRKSEMTLSELSLFIEGADVEHAMSPQLLRKVDLQTKFSASMQR
jgi:transposase